ncbi:hypothetical protein IQ247_01980 [Plectonema cf. radiosum LEGE 06105]|uniref:Uncharacterized protein n=1 Tax=Plectonema cf. radiosum LEGE 06105 TaxID=945769 RepID=A0A8J7K167_9CYAN|nr:hypothetical protein [Plectonema radiosum]MBE9211497.1 hypothetical protein [Plectonema cf. radiosum LEGE 06105]
MSTIPESNYQLEGKKMFVSLILKVPLQFEIELRGMEDAKLSQFNQEEDLNSAINKNSNLINNEINQAEINQKSQVLSNLLVTQILDSHNHILSHINESELPSDNPDNSEIKLEILPKKNSLNTPFNSEDKSESNEQAISTTNKKRKLRLGDSLNDSLSLVVNIVGAMLFLGKLSNYSWE